MKIIDDVPETSQTTQEAPQSVSKENPIDSGYHAIEELPSAGRFYPEGTIIYGRPLKVIECKQLSSLNENNGDALINSVLRRAIKGIDVEKILVADKLYILLWLRGTTFPSSDYGIDFTCDLCKKSNKYNLSLDHIQTRQIEESFTLDKLHFKIPNGDEIDFSFPTIAEEKLADQFKANMGSKIPDLDSDIVSQCVLLRKINGESKTMLEKYNYIATMKPSDYTYMLSYIEHWSFGIKWVIDVSCKECGGANTISAIFFMSSEFFLPRYDFSKD
jgi:hypothetical protein